MAVQSFAALFCATIWSILLVGWFLVFPGIGSIGGILLFGAGAITSFVALLVLFGARVARSRFDALAGTLLATINTIVVIAAWSPLIDLGVRLRLSLVQDRYEQAIAANEVETAGGFREGDLAGWVWFDQLVLDPAAGVVFDPSDRLEERTEREPVGVQAFAELMTCDRIERYWYWCWFS